MAWQRKRQLHSSGNSKWGFSRYALSTQLLVQESSWNQECTFIKVRYCTFFSFYQKKTSGLCCKIRCRGGVYFTREKPYKVPIAEFAIKSISSPKWFSLSWENHTPFLSKVRKVELRYTPHRYTHVISLRVFTAAGAYKFVFARIRHVSNMFLLSMFWLEYRPLHVTCKLCMSHASPYISSNIEH